MKFECNDEQHQRATLVGVVVERLRNSYGPAGKVVMRDVIHRATEEGDPLSYAAHHETVQSRIYILYVTYTIC